MKKLMIGLAVTIALIVASCVIYIPVDIKPQTKASIFSVSNSVSIITDSNGVYTTVDALTDALTNSPFSY